MTEVLNAVEGIQSTGDFATFHPSTTATPPGVTVNDIGQISMPLKEDQARQLIDKARLAPFGKGSETIVDTTVRNTWELNPAEFQLSEGWEANLRLIRDVVAKDLGIRAPIRAELYKMLIYEKGAMFKPHTE